MSRPNQGRVVGDACEVCSTPLISGKNGAYCKPCYIKWADKNKGSSGSTVVNNSSNGKTFNVKAMMLSYAKDLAVARIGAGGDMSIPEVLSVADKMLAWHDGRKEEQGTMDMPASDVNNPYAN